MNRPESIGTKLCSDMRRYRPAMTIARDVPTQGRAGVICRQALPSATSGQIRANTGSLSNNLTNEDTCNP